MNRVHVHSSTITSIGYSAHTRTLEVEFKTGAIYSYSDVPPEEYAGFMAAPSKGNYHAIHIRGIYDYRKL